MSDQVPAWAKWVLGIVAGLIGTGVCVSIGLAFSERGASTEFRTEMRLRVESIESRLGDDQTIKDLKRQDSLHWRYDGYLHKHINRLYQLANEPIPDPPDLTREGQP